MACGWYVTYRLFFRGAFGAGEKTAVPANTLRKYCILAGRPLHRFSQHRSLGETCCPNALVGFCSSEAEGRERGSVRVEPVGNVKGESSAILKNVGRKLRPYLEERSSCGS